MEHSEAVLGYVQKGQSQRKRGGTKAANRLDLSMALTSEHVTPFEIEAV